MIAMGRMFTSGLFVRTWESLPTMGALTDKHLDISPEDGVLDWAIWDGIQSGELRRSRDRCQYVT